MKAFNVLRSVGLLVGTAAAIALWTGEARAQVFDEVNVKDGSVIIGEITDMVDGTLTIKAAFGGDLKIAWADITSVKTVKPLPFVLNDGTELRGMAGPGGDGQLAIQVDALGQATTVPLKAILAINPPPKKEWSFRGTLNIGASVSGGNTHTRNVSLLGEFVIRAAQHRVTMRGQYSYADDEDGVTAQYGMGGLNYAYFMTKRFYVYANALFEHDGIADLKLRTALTGGPGYQFVERGDYKQSWLKELSVSGEAGIGYFNEDYKDDDPADGEDPDQSYVAARWALKIDWPFLPKQVSFFHFDEGYPSLEDAQDLYITTETGLRFTLLKNFVASAQVNWRWDTTPAPGFKRSDVLYLLTI